MSLIDLVSMFNYNWKAILLWFGVSLGFVVFVFGVLVVIELKSDVWW